MMPTVNRRGMWAVLLLGLLVIAIGPASAAIQLVHMHNGRVLKAKSVERDGDWLMATLDGGATVGVEASEVDFVEEDPLGREDFGAPANVVTSGREVVRRGAFAGNRGNRGAAGNQQNPLESQQQQAPNTNNGGVANPNLGGAVQPGVAGRAPGVQAPGSAATAQPTVGVNGRTQTPGRSSRFNRLGSTPRSRGTGDN